MRKIEQIICSIVSKLYTEVNSIEEVENLVNQRLNEAYDRKDLRSCDGLAVGNKESLVSGIVVTFSASIQVIKEAIAKNCNLIITHEPTFYNHTDEDERMKCTSLYEKKMALLEENNIAVWRFHDLCHLLENDFILEGVLKKADFYSYMTLKEKGFMVLEQKTNVRQIVKELREKLGATAMRFVGDGNQEIKRFGLFSGKPDNLDAILFFEKYNLDLLIIGEINEWELGDFTRDHLELGENKSLLIMGHQPSEMAGMEYFGEWLKDLLPFENIEFVSTINRYEII